MMISYFVRIKPDGKLQGPFTAEQLKKLASQGKLKPDHQISTDGTSWHAASSVKGLEFAGTDSDPLALDDEGGASVGSGGSRRRTIPSDDDNMPEGYGAEPPEGTRRKRAPNRGQTRMPLFRIGCAVIILATIIGVPWYFYRMMVRSFEEEALRHVEMVCGARVRDAITEDFGMDTPKKAVEIYRAKYPAGHFGTEVETAFYNACIGSTTPQNAPNRLTERIRQFRETYPESPRVKECEKWLATGLQKTFSCEAMVALMDNYPHSSDLSDAANGLAAYLNTTEDTASMEEFQTKLEANPILSSHAAYATLISRELARVETAELPRGGDCSFFRKYAARLEALPKNASTAFAPLVDLNKARKIHTPAAYREYIRRHGLSHPGRWFALYWLAESSCESVVEIKNPTRTVMMIGPGQIAEQPGWAVYVLCAGWPSGSREKHYTTRLEYSEKEATEIITSLPYNGNTLLLDNPINIHRRCGHFVAALENPKSGSILVQAVLDIESNPDIDLYDHRDVDIPQYSYDYATRKIVFFGNTLTPRKMEFSRQSESMEEWRRRFLADGAEKALATLPAPPGELRGILESLRKGASREFDPRNDALARYAEKVLSIH